MKVSPLFFKSWSGHNAHKQHRLLPLYHKQFGTGTPFYDRVSPYKDVHTDFIDVSQSTLYQWVTVSRTFTQPVLSPQLSADENHWYNFTLNWLMEKWNRPFTASASFLIHVVTLWWRRITFLSTPPSPLPFCPVNVWRRRAGNWRPWLTKW